MKNIIVFVLLLPLFTSCLSDEEKRLQTDQTYEGEEMFHLSYSMDEHLSYSLHPYRYYQDTVNHPGIPGCPEVSLDQFVRKVTLTFGEVECVNGQPGRSGKITLSYPDSLKSEEKTVKIGYDAYNVRGIRIEGTRTLHYLDSAATEVTLNDSISNIVFTDANHSTSKMTGVFFHQVVEKNDSLQYFTTTGSGMGRNLAGRPFHMEISQAKYFSGECIRNGFFVPESGKEIWVFERSVSENVSHSVNYQPGEDCDNKAQIRLYNGQELTKSQ